MTDFGTRWNVLIDRYPEPPGRKVGQVFAETRDEAMAKAIDHYGKGYVVMRQTAREMEEGDHGKQVD